MTKNHPSDNVSLNTCYYLIVRTKIRDLIYFQIIESSYFIVKLYIWVIKQFSKYQLYEKEYHYTRHMHRMCS